MSYPQTDTIKAYFDLLSKDHRGIIRMVWPDFKNTLSELHKMTPNEFVKTYIQYLLDLDNKEYNDSQRRFLFKKENIGNKEKEANFENLVNRSNKCNCCGYKTDKNVLYIFAYHLHGNTWH